MTSGIQVSKERIAFYISSGNHLLVTLAVVGGLLIAVAPPNLPLGALVVIMFAIIVLISPIAALSLMLIVLPLRALILTEAPNVIPFDISPLMVALFLFTAFVHRMVFVRKPMVSVPPLITIVGLFVLTLVISGLSTFSVTSWGQETFKWVLLLVIAYTVSNLLDERAWEWLLVVLCAAGVANAVIGIHIFFGGSGALHLLVNDRFFRAFGTFGQPNPFGGFMGITASLALGMATGYLQVFWALWKEDHSSWKQTIIPLGYYAMSTTLLTTGVLVSWSRGAWLAFSAGILVMLFALPRRWWQRFAMIMVVIAIAGHIWISGYLPATFSERLASAAGELLNPYDVRAVDITTTNYPIVERLAHWQAAVDMAEGNFWFGVGAGNYEAAYETYRLINWDEPLGHAHNFYLNVLGETGIIGLTTYLFMTVSVFALAWQALKHPDKLARSAILGLLGAWVYLTIHSLTDNLYVNNLYIHIGVILGIIAKLHRDISSMRVSVI